MKEDIVRWGIFIKIEDKEEDDVDTFRMWNDYIRYSVITTLAKLSFIKSFFLLPKSRISDQKKKNAWMTPNSKNSL